MGVMAKLHSVSCINLYGASNYKIFSNHLRIRLSPIKSPILLKYKNPYKRNSMYPNISKCNAKSCTCCNHLICRSTIISSVNHRQFSVVNQRMLYMLSLAAKEAEECSMLDRPNGPLKQGLRNICLKPKKQRKLIRFFINISGVLAIHDQLVKFWFNLLKKIIRKSNSTERFKNILRHEFELNGLNVYKPLFHLDLMIIFTMEEIFLKCRISMLFPFQILKNVTNDPMVSAKMAILNGNIKLFYLFLI